MARLVKPGRPKEIVLVDSLRIDPRLLVDRGMGDVVERGQVLRSSLRVTREPCHEAREHHPSLGLLN